jgi:hypothetical protein
MTESIDIAISNQQKTLEAYKLEMEAVRQQFIKASAVFLALWYKATAKHYVSTESQNTLTLGQNKLSAMKMKLRNLTDETEKIANDFLSEHSLWWHLTPNGENGVSLYVQNGSKCPKIIDDAIRKAQGKLGLILEEFGYAVTTSGRSTGDDISVWNNKNVGPFPINPMPYYPDSFDWSKEMKDIMRRYSEIYKQAYDSYSDIRRLRKLKLDKQAADLWDSA